MKAILFTFMTTGLGVATLTAPDNKSFADITSFLRTTEAPDLFNRWLGFGVSMLVVAPAIYALVHIILLLLQQEQEQKQSETSSGKTKQKEMEPTEVSGRTFVGDSTYTLGEETSNKNQETKIL